MQLKAYAATQSLTPRLTDEYTSGRGANASEIIRQYYHEGEGVKIGSLVLWYNLLFIPFGMLVICFVLYNFNELILSFLGKESDEHDGNARKIAVIVLCTLFWVYVFSLDCCALHYLDKIPPAVSKYHNENDSSYLYVLPVLAFLYDAIFPLLFYFFYIGWSIRMICKEDENDTNDRSFLDYTILYALFLVMNIVSNHLMYILIAFINNSVHATGILIYYLIFVALYLASIKKLILLCYRCYFKYNCGCFFLSIVLAIAVSVILIGLGALIIVLYVYLPIKDSVHDVPKQIQSLFQFMSAFFLGLLTYKLLQN